MSSAELPTHQPLTTASFFNPNNNQWKNRPNTKREIESIVSWLFVLDCFLLGWMYVLDICVATVLLFSKYWLNKKYLHYISVLCQTDSGTPTTKEIKLSARLDQLNQSIRHHRFNNNSPFFTRRWQRENSSQF